MTGCLMMGQAPVCRVLTCLSCAHMLILTSGTWWVIAHDRKTASGHPSALGWAVKKQGAGREAGSLHLPFLPRPFSCSLQHHCPHQSAHAVTRGGQGPLTDEQPPCPALRA